MFAFLNSKLKAKLENIDSSTLRGEYKVNIYSRFALPSIRFYFSVHQIHKTHMSKLDDMARKYLKKWLGIQTNGVTDVSIFHPYMLNIKTPSNLYLEAHAGSYASIRLKGDEIVNHALNTRLERESKWSKKFSTIKTVDKIFKENIETGKISLENNHKSINIAKKVMKVSLKNETLKHWNSVVKKLTFQGDFFNLLIEEESNVTWQSIRNNIPKGVLSFAVKACSNGLNTPDNLKRWGQRKLEKCNIWRTS